MYHVKLRENNRERRKLLIRSRVSGTAEKPRLTVFRSNKYIYAQLIDDVQRATLVAVSSEVKELHKTGTKVESAAAVGKLVAEKALKLGITKAVFDRNGYKFHGRVKSLADAAREGGLTI
jgi:large subunit ribosomal protein L18